MNKWPPLEQDGCCAPVPSHPTHWCVLTNREERAAAMQRQYLDYVVRFERSDRRRGWLRFLVRKPLAASCALFKGRPLPREWRRDPLREDDFWAERYLKYLGRMTPKD